MDERRAAVAKIVIHLTSGAAHPTRAALDFLVAKAAVEDGEAVSLFRARDPAQLIRHTTRDALQGLGTGRLKDSYDAILGAGGRLYLSGMSSTARGITESDLRGKTAELVPPHVLVRLILEHDRVLTY